jgi:hypothetical protein
LRKTTAMTAACAASMTLLGCGASSDGSPSGRPSDDAGNGGDAGSTGAGDDGGASSGGGDDGGVASGDDGGGTSGGAMEAGPSGPPTGIAVTTTNVGVDGKGKVFNVADDYFNDGFVPPTPVANFGLHSQIITHPNADGSLDVAWLDYAGGKSAPWAVPDAAPIYITHIDATLRGGTTRDSGVRSYKLLGFTEDGSGDVYLAYNKDHPFKTSAMGDENNLNGNELHVTKLAGATGGWDRLVFGDQDNNVEATLGDPGGAASSVLGWDGVANKVVVYCGHSMMWGGVRHQAGFMRVLDAVTGTIENPAGDDIIHFGAGWFYSHNFNQRLIIDGSDYYVLTHGDAYARRLGFARWSLDKYRSSNATEFDSSIWDIDGSEGDNDTNAQTGQFQKLADGRFLVVHTSGQSRAARDVRIVAASGSDGSVDGAGARWLTTNAGGTHATIAKLHTLGDYVVVTYGLWKEGGHDLTWYATVLDSSLATVAPAAPIAGVEFVDSEPLFVFAGGPNAGKLGWVSGNASHTLGVNVAALK